MAHEHTPLSRHVAREVECNALTTPMRDFLQHEWCEISGVRSAKYPETLPIR